MERDAFYQPDKGEVKRNREIVAAMVLCIIGFIMMISSAQNFWMSLKPEYDVEYLLDNGAREGMHVNQQQTGHAPGEFTDMLMAGNFPSSGGHGRGVAEL